MLRVAVDMDGVCVDWVGRCCEYFGVNTFECDQTQYSWMIDRIGSQWADKLSQKFWYKMRKTQECDPLIRGIEALGLRWFFCTTPPNRAARAGKLTWVENHFPGIEVVFLNDKSLIASAEMVLIDDYEENIREFHATGGKVICFPRPWNCNRNYERVAVAGTICQLEHFKTGKVGLFANLEFQERIADAEVHES